MDPFHEALQLVNALATIVGISPNIRSAEMPPLEAVHRPKITLLPAKKQDLFKKL